MRYLYKCPYCLAEVTIEKPMAESSKVEFCEICEGELKRVYKVAVSTGDGFKQ